MKAEMNIYFLKQVKNCLWQRVQFKKNKIEQRICYIYNYRNGCWIIWRCRCTIKKSRTRNYTSNQCMLADDNLPLEKMALYFNLTLDEVLEIKKFLRQAPIHSVGLWELFKRNFCMDAVKIGKSHDSFMRIPALFIFT